MCFGGTTTALRRSPEKTVSTSVRLPKSLKALIEEHVRLDTHVNASDFIREAIREKVLREAPHLHHRLFAPAEGDPGPKGR